MTPEELRPTLESLRERPDDLIEIILRQAGVIEELRQKITQLEGQIKDLDDRNNGLSAKVEHLETVTARQAGPFRIPEKDRKANPKPPGRPKGHPGSQRTIPDHVDEEIVVPLEACPQCGRDVSQCRPVVQYLEELPVLRPHVIKLTTHEGECSHCQQMVRSTHPLQVSLAAGAAGVQLGARALGLAALLNKQQGLTVRKTCAVLREVFQLRLSPGGLTQALARLARKLTPAYEKLVARLRDGPYVHADETSWWVGGPGHWLWVFADKTTTVYHVAEGRGRQIVQAMLGPAYGGVLVSDCLATYDDVNEPATEMLQPSSQSHRAGRGRPAQRLAGGGALAAGGGHGFKT